MDTRKEENVVVVENHVEVVKVKENRVERKENQRKEKHAVEDAVENNLDKF